MTTLALSWVLAFTDAGSEPQGDALITFLVPLVILGGVFYFFVIMPQRRRMRSMQSMRASLQVGDEVRTIGGIKGVIRSIDGDDLVLDVGGGTTLDMVVRAVAERLGDDAE